MREPTENITIANGFGDYLQSSDEFQFLLEEYIGDIAKQNRNYYLVVNMKKYRTEYSEEQKERVKQYYADDGNYIIPQEVFHNFFDNFSPIPIPSIDQVIRNHYKIYEFTNQKASANITEWFPSKNTFDEENIDAYFAVIVIGPSGTVVYSNE